MKRESVFSVVFLIILVASSPAALAVQRVEASGTIYIRADGSIDPQDAPISTVGNVTYTFTGNVTSDADGIVVERDNIVVDGAGYTLQGTNNYETRGTIVTGRSNVTIKNTNIKNYFHGIMLASSSNITISGNNITNNWFDIQLLSSSNNSIYHNNIGSGAGFIWGSVNIWDDGYPSGGNCWSNYNGTDGNGDGVGDTPYIIDDNNIDNYPLMGMFSEFDWVSIAAPEQRIQTICNSTISNLIYNGTAISFDVSGDNGTSGFCRIQIPKVFMNSTFAVFVNGTEIAYTLLPSSNEYYTYLYFNYTHSIEQVIIIPEFPSFLIPSLFMIATLLAVIIYRRKHSQNE